MVVDSVNHREPLLGQVNQSKAAMMDTDFHRLHRKYCDTNVANAGKPEDCGQPNPTKSLESPKSPRSNTGKNSRVNVVLDYCR